MPLGVGFSSLPTVAGKKAISAPLGSNALTVCRDLSTSIRPIVQLGRCIAHVGDEDRFASPIELLSGIEAPPAAPRSYEISRRWPRAGWCNRAPCSPFMSSIFAGSFFRNGPFTSFSVIVYWLTTASRLLSAKLVPDLLRDRLVECQPVGLGKCPQRLLRVFGRACRRFRPERTALGPAEPEPSPRPDRCLSRF